MSRTSVRVREVTIRLLVGASARLVLGAMCFRLVFAFGTVSPPGRRLRLFYPLPRRGLNP